MDRAYRIALLARRYRALAERPHAIYGTPRRRARRGASTGRSRSGECGRRWPGELSIQFDRLLALDPYLAAHLDRRFAQPTFLSGEHVSDTGADDVAVGTALPQMPLFLRPDRYVNVPLEATYQEAYRGLPGFWREVLERQP